MPPTAKILIVDDEPRLCQSLSSLLRSHGFDIQVAYSGQETNSLLKNTTFDIALIDLFLPDISGLELMIQVQKEIPDITIVIMTGNASVETAIKTLQEGAYDYLTKPFEPAKLVQTIKNALQQKELAHENKSIHRQLAVSRRDYKYLVENSPDVIYMLDKKGRFTFVNPSIEHLTGLPPKHVIGQHYSTLLNKTNMDSDHWTFKERRTGKRAKQWKQLKLSTFNPSGIRSKKILHTELQSTGIYQAKKDGSTDYIGTHGVIRDITEKKKAHLKKKRIKAQLQRAEKLEVVGTLASGVAHDLNNLLSGILTYPELLLMEMSKENPHRDYIQKIKKSGEDAAIIVSDLLTLARRRLPANTIFNMDDIISDCLTGPQYLKLKSLYPDIRFSINLNTCALNMKGSPVHISKCILNLLNNAAESMPKGGTITILTQTCCIEKPNDNDLDLAPGKYIKLVVADTGIGISENDIKKIFDPFYSRKKMGRSGTGLGMTIVWTTTKDHKGHIDIQSTEGKGTTIALYYPVTLKEKNFRQKLDIDQIKGNGQSILIVDDISEQRDMATTMLTALGYTTVSVSTGQACIEYIESTPIDLILLDMILGTDMDGLNTYRKIKEVRPDQRVIIISGQIKTERIKTALELGVCQFIKKPYSIETMGTALKKHLPMVTNQLRN